MNTKLLETKELLVDAVQRIERSGWTKCQMSDDEGRICALGGLYLAATGLESYKARRSVPLAVLVVENGKQRALNRARVMLTDSVVRICGHEHDIMDYNDRFDTTQEKILRVFYDTIADIDQMLVANLKDEKEKEAVPA